MLFINVSSIYAPTIYFFLNFEILEIANTFCLYSTFSRRSFDVDVDFIEKED